MSDDHDKDRLYLQRIEDLTAKLAAASAEAMKRRKALRHTEEVLADVAAERDAAVSDRDAIKAQAAATPGEHAAALKDLQAKLRGRDVADKFAEHLNDLAEGVTPAKAFKAAGFDPTSEEAEKADPAELVARLRESDGYLFKPAGATPAADPRGSTAEKPPLVLGGTQGRGLPDKGSRQTTYTAAEVAKYGWQKSRPELVAALKDGTAVLTG